MKQNFLAICVIIVAVLCFYAAVALFLPVQAENTYYEVEIPKGVTYRQALKILKDQRLIRDRYVFLVLGRLTGADRKIRAGFYSLWGSMSPLEIFNTIRRGQIIEYEITIVEGDSIFEVADKFADLGIMADAEFVQLATDPEFLSFHSIQSSSAEGYLFPDTYLIPKGMDPEDAIGLMINRMRAMYSPELVARTLQLGMTENEVLTLASIIEKEAVIDSERSLISAVYHNRLKRNMRLQADPTAVYGVKRSNQKILLSDLRRETPYNTYSISGLPPGPIASPGLKSIRAALYPADVPYLFFVSKGNLTHHFSRTASEHLRAVEFYRQVRESKKEGEEVAPLKLDES